MFKHITKILAIVAMAVGMTACTRIETGEVGLRQKLDKTYDMTELQPGSWNQTLVGNVRTFKVKEVAAIVNNLTPLAADNSALADFDAQVIYSLNPASVAELWTKESASFHVQEQGTGDVLLMNLYMQQVLRNAATKAVREYPSLKLGDNRSQIEVAIKVEIEKQLEGRKLGGAINISQVQVTSMQPSGAILASANRLVTAENDLKQKTIEVETAKKEAERIAALNANSKAIEYMNAQANYMIAEGVRAGKVQTIVVPVDFKGIVQTGK